jgi:hypothetical protein
LQPQLGPLRLEVTERQVDQASRETFEHRQTGECQTYRDHWNLADEFVGVGT